MNAYMRVRAGIEAMLADPTLADDEVRPLRTALIRVSHDGLRGLEVWALAEGHVANSPGCLVRIHDLLDSAVPGWRTRVERELENEEC